MRPRTRSAPRAAAGTARAAASSALAGLVLGVSLLAGPAARAGTADPTAADVAQWRGRYCTPLGCGPDRGASWAGLTGFGLAVLAAAHLGRRQRP